MEKKLELLAPAGSYESMKAAVNAGADAVYMGGSRYGARAYADNPKEEQLLEAIDYAHLHGVKLYLTINTLLKERELEEDLYAYLLPYYEHGLDAVIVQDVGVLCAVREWFPDLSVHASTQMTVCGIGGVKFLEREGVRRVVLARELSLAEIAGINRNTETELECFVHGALCYSYSGQCLFSSILGGRSGNRGRCAQPCRLKYEALADRKPVSGKEERSLLSPRDICALELIPQIAEAGVCSLKIEGRMKRPEYTAGVVRIYRKYVDRYLQYGAEGYHVSEKDKRELLLLFNREGFSQGYYRQHNGRELMALSGKKTANRGKKEYEALLLALGKEYVESEKKLPVRGLFCAEEGRPMRLQTEIVSGGKKDAKSASGMSLTVYGDCPQVPKNRPMEAEQFAKQLKKTGNTPFEWSELKICLQGPLFVPLQSLNSLRREAFLNLQKEAVSSFRRPGKGRADNRSVYLPEEIPSKECRKLHISVQNREQLEEVLAMADCLKIREETPLSAVYVDAELTEAELTETVTRIHGKHLKAFVMLPPIFRKKTAGRYKDRKDYWLSLPLDGYVIRNLEEYEFLQEFGLLESGWKKEIILDHNVYTFNRRSRRFWRERGVWMQTNPLEQNGRELAEISSGDSIQIIYGRYPMMVTAGCLHRTLNECRQKEELWILRDRYRKEFPVKNHCKDCYNVIYNSEPLYLLDLQAELMEQKAGAYRIMFTTENRKETVQILEDFMEHRKSGKAFTRGHFKRGVE